MNMSGGGGGGGGGGVIGVNNKLKLLETGNICLFDLILCVHSTIFQLCGTGLPGLNQY